MKPTCTYDAARGWCTAEHQRDCADHECRGCKPCPKTHCAMRGRCANHVEPAAGIYTCPSCIGKVRRDITAVENLAALMPTQAIEDAERDGLDSDALNLAGPAATADQVDGRRRYADLERGWCEWPRDDERHHPYAVLGRWDLALRESYGPQTDLFVTVTSAADYLRKLLAGGFPHTREFMEFASEVATCRTHLEQVIHTSRQPEKGAPCPTCSTQGGDRKPPRLVKHYAQHAVKDGEIVHKPCGCGDEPHCRICAGHDDTWHCSANTAHWWSEPDYRSRIDGAYRAHAEALPTRELAERTGVSVSTIRRWAGRTYLGTDEHGEAEYGEPRLKARGRSKDGRKLYRVADVLALRSRVSLDAGPVGVSKSG